MALAGPTTRQADRATLKRITQQMSKALRDSHGGGLMERFESVSKLLFTKIVDERRTRGEWGGLPAREAQLRVGPGDSDAIVYERARAVWHEATTGLRHVFAGSRSQFPGDVAAVARIVGLLEDVDLADTPADVKGAVYEELLRNTFEKNENQQYFTPRQIVEFMVALADVRLDDKVCDPACGSGGFLVGALAGVSPNVDLELRGAEVDERMAWVARINMLMHGADPKAIFTLRGSASLAPLATVTDALPADHFSLILTNPPFGSDMTDRTSLNGFVTGRGRASRRRGILFVERCIELLAPGGRLAIVLDDSVLNLPSNRDVRDLVLERSVVEAVVSLPDVAFMPYSTAKSSILVVRRRVNADEPQGPVFMADVEHVGNRPNGDPLYSDEVDGDGHRTLRSDLPGVLDLYRQDRSGHAIRGESIGGTAVFTADLTSRDNPDRRLDPFFFHPAREEAEARLGRARVALHTLEDLVVSDASVVSPAVEYGDELVRWVGLGDIESETGRYEVKAVIGDRVKSNAHVFRGGDVLFSRLRPKLRKVVYVAEEDEGGVCSAELLVLRVRPEHVETLSPRFLTYMLRSDLVFGQLIYQVTGVGRPRVTAQALRKVILPVPSAEDQERLLEQLETGDREAAQLRVDALSRLDQARARMEHAYETVLDQLLPAAG